MKTSVFIPCYNEQSFLPDCLESLVLQTHPADEIIICDNNSTDNSIEIIKKYTNKLPIKIIKQPIKGILPTVEKAWRETKGDIVIRTDADAVFPPDWIKNIKQHFINDPKLAACGGEWVPYKETRFWTTLTHLGFILGDIVFPIVRGYEFLFGPNTAVRRTAMVKINGYITDEPFLVDDQLISFKLHNANLKYQKYPDCWNFHSSRRFHLGTKHLIRYAISAFAPQYYQEKST
jgi:cellulose synthase/poly-beta-1,6-N-acetylglucosamine synthase-like glycosyltransferase